MADGKDGNPQQTAGDPETGRITTIEQIAERQQATDAKVDGLIGKIDQLIGGGKAPEPPAAPGVSGHGGQDPGAGMDAIRQAIRDVHAEDDQARKQADHDAEHDRLKAARDAAEHQPREAMKPWKDKLQRVMFGGDR